MGECKDARESEHQNARELCGAIAAQDYRAIRKLRRKIDPKNVDWYDMEEIAHAALVSGDPKMLDLEWLFLDKGFLAQTFLEIWLGMQDRNALPDHMANALLEKFGIERPRQPRNLIYIE